MTSISSLNYAKKTTRDLSEVLVRSLDNSQVDFRGCVINNSKGTQTSVEVGFIKGKGIFYIKIGSILFIDSRFKSVLEKYSKLKTLDQIVFVHKFQAFLNQPSNLFYTLSTMAAIDDIDLKNMTILDLGCAEGILGLMALKKGANQVLGVDINSEVVGRFRENLRLNNIQEGKSSLLITGFNNQKVILENTPVSKIDIIFANIGPHFGSSDLEAFSLLKFIPTTKVVIGGGYNYASADLSYRRALVRLGKFGFSKSLKFYYPENKFHIAFRVKRKGG